MSEIEEEKEFSKNIVSKIGYREASKEATEKSLEAKDKYDKTIEELGLTDKAVNKEEQEKTDDSEAR